MKFSIVPYKHGVRIYCDGILHLVITKYEFVGLHSWEDVINTYPVSTPKPLYKYFIEVFYRDTSILVEYNTRDKWVSVLELLNKSDL